MHSLSPTMFGHKSRGGVRGGADRTPLPDSHFSWFCLSLSVPLSLQSSGLILIEFKWEDVIQDRKDQLNYLGTRPPFFLPPLLMLLFLSQISDSLTILTISGNSAMGVANIKSFSNAKYFLLFFTILLFFSTLRFLFC